jgi:hypothetical protein
MYFLVMRYALGTTSRISRRGEEIDLMDRRHPNSIATTLLEDSQTDENDGIIEDCTQVNIWIIAVVIAEKTYEGPSLTKLKPGIPGSRHNRGDLEAI